MSARDPFQEIEAALSFPVSPDFCARVRQQVAAQPVRPRMFGDWKLAAAAAVVLVAGIGLITTVRHRDVPVTQIDRPDVAGATRLPVERHAAVVAKPRRVAQQPIRAAAREATSAFETLVPDDQLHALDRLMAAMREGRATVPLAESNDELNDRGERVLRALVIEPLAIEPLAGTPAEPNKNPVKDPNK